MTSASKKRRRREREKRSQDIIQRARAFSLVDAVSPGPTIYPSPKNRERDDIHDRNSLVFSNDHNSPVSSPKNNLPKEPSWKRVDFVLPRAKGKKNFVFDQKPKTNLDENLLPSVGSGNDNSQKAIKLKKSETIEDIFGNKRHKEHNSQHQPDFLPDKETDSRKKARRGDGNELNGTESSCRKLEDAFEVANGESKNPPIDNFVDVAIKEENLSPGSTKETSKASPRNDDIKKSDEKRKSKEKARSKISMQPTSPGQITGRTVKEAVRDKRGLRPRANSTDGELNLPQGGLCDERMILEAHKWKSDRKYMNHSLPRGFHNLGNTCFLNATLQCLTYLPPLCQTLIAISEDKMRNGQNGGKKKVPQGQKITSSLCSLFQQARGLNNNSKGGEGPFAPRKVVSHLPNIGSCGSRNGYKFRLGRQEDAHEFLVHLLDAMNDGELRAAGINQNTSGWRDRLPVSRLDETTFVHRIFGGYFRSQVRCRRCNYRSNTYDPFLDLSLEVSKKSSTSVLKALSEFTRKETLDAANQWKCSGCKKYVCATKQLTVFRPPLTLCIQLKRFAFDNFGFGQKYSKYSHGYGGGSKITKPIEFPGTLQLPLSDNRSCQYTLTGIVIHVGGSSQSGHYTAYVKKPVKNGTSQWYHMDDSEVQPVSERTVLKQRDAYVLFYCRTEVKLEFPDPPSRSMTALEATEFGRNRARARADSFSMETSREGLKGNVNHKKECMAEELLLAESIPQPQEHETSERNMKDENSKKLKTTNMNPLKKIHTENIGGRPTTVEKTEGTLLTSPLSNGEAHSFSKVQDDPNDSSDDSSYKGSSSGNSNSADSESINGDFSDGSTEGSSRKCHEKKTIDNKESRSASSSDDSSESEMDSDDDLTSDGKMAIIDKNQSGCMSSSKRSAKEASEYSESDNDDDDVSVSSDKKTTEDHKQDRSYRPSTHFQGKSIESPDSESDRENKSSPNDKKKALGSINGKIDVHSKHSAKNETEFSESEIDSRAESSKNGKKERSGERDMVGPAQMSQNPSPITKNANKTTVVVNNTDSRGKVKVMLGPRKRKIWASKASALPSKAPDFQLLGNMKVSQWGDDDDDTNKNGDKPIAPTKKSEASQVHCKRKTIIDKIDKQNRVRKRKMHLDRWDSHLDQGKQKKVKSESKSAPIEASSMDPKKNVFQRIQSSVQRMSRGKQKGSSSVFRRKSKKTRARF